MENNENMVKCCRCKKMHEFKMHNMCERCRNIKITEGNIKCLKCNNDAKNDTNYCLLHKKYHIKDELEKQGKTICSNFNTRSCTEEINTSLKFKTCEKCRDKDKTKTVKSIEKYKDNLKQCNNDEKICKRCKKIFKIETHFFDNLGNETTNCSQCRHNQNIRDLKRK